MDIEGTIIQYIGRQEGTSKAGNAWKKDEYVMETPGTYPRKVKFTIFGDRCETMKCEIGKAYVLSCDIESREFNGRWYTDVNVFAVRPVEGAAQPAVAQAAPQAAAPQPMVPAADPFQAPAGDSSDDLPF